MEDEKVISRIKAKVDIPSEPPAEYLEKWKQSMLNAGTKMGENIKNSISGLGDYAQKMANHNIKDKIEFFNPNYRTRSGRTYESIINSMISNMPAGYNKYKGKIEQAFEKVDGEENKRFNESIESQSYQSALKIARTSLPFTGYGNKIRGIAPFAARWLSGNPEALKLTKPGDYGIEGGPVLITQPERAGEFRQRLINRIRQAGARIVKYGFAPFIIADENALTNQLVSEYLLDGLAARVDFVLENTLLYLDIQVFKS
ncbi:MAG: hypothetical protein HY811_01075 [Planctomycetes bacterium]|nr:hypothetical protein [Planctomycetota bacterium]